MWFLGYFLITYSFFFYLPLCILRQAQKTARENQRATIIRPFRERIWWKENHFDHVNFMKLWYEMEKSIFNIGRDLDFFVHIPKSIGSLWVNWNHCESKHKLRYSSSIRKEVSGWSAQRPGAKLVAYGGKITHIAAAGPWAVAGSCRFSPASAPVPGKVDAVPDPTASLGPAAVGREWGCAWSLRWAELHVGTVLNNIHTVCMYVVYCM